MKKTIVISLFFVTALAAIGQVRIQGVVLDEKTAEPIIGAAVQVDGSTIGTATDIDGQFVLEVDNNDAVLTISYMGYLPQQLSAKRASKVLLREDTKMLEEVVVVGYGVQKKSVVTAAISKVTAEDMEKAIPTRVDNLLKGKASGVTVTTTSGQPGAGSQVRIRGVGTINDASPLYVVDGMPMSSIDHINPTDIESIEVLKDAASAAIYGTKGANGVILVTTKTGGYNQKARVGYDMNVGWQNPWKQKAVLNGPWYQTILNEARINDGAQPYFSQITTDPGTNWQDALFNYNALVQSHQVHLDGGSDKVIYYLSFGYLGQDGIVGGNFGRSNYKRYSARVKNLYKVFDAKDRNWLKRLDISANVSYARTESTGITENSSFYSSLGSALLIDPTMPVYAKDPAAVLEKYPTAVKDKDGRVYSVPDITMNEIINPVANLELPGGKNYADHLTANVQAELEIYSDLKFKTSFNGDLVFNNYEVYSYPYYLSSGGAGSSTTSSVNQSLSRTWTWQVENTLSYNHNFSGHTVGALIGQSASKTSYTYVSGTAYDLPTYDPYKAVIDYAQGSQEEQRAGGSRSYTANASYFVRLNYDYKERYLFQTSVRVDGSDKFGPNNRWGVFPSFSLGWNVAKENFFAQMPRWWSGMKLRGSWGMNGNDRISDFAYMALVVGGSNYTFGRGESETVVTGVRQSRLSNPDLKWETSQQTDVGLELSWLNNSLTFNFDYYHKVTKDMLMTALMPAYVGVEEPWCNGGQMLNWGLEFDLSYRFNVRDVYFTLSGNLSYLKNKLIDYGNESGSANLDAVQGVGTVSRAQNGEVYPFFYGYKTDGLFQTAEEAAKYVNAKGERLQPNAVAGDVRFVDTNGDGVINDDDRVKIGKGMPDITYAFTLGIEWRGIDLNAFFQGVAGNQIFDATRRVDLSTTNQPAWIIDRWTGPGTSTKIPRVTQLDPNDNWRSSDLYIKNGAYMRLKTLQLGYSLPASWMKKIHFQKIRIYLSGENLFTVTKYDGFDPEIGSGGTSIGIDYGCYPQSRTLSVGANIAF